MFSPKKILLQETVNRQGKKQEEMKTKFAHYNKITVNIPNMN